MNGRIIDMLLRLAPRERLLLGALVLIVLPAALWVGVLSPLAERRSAAADALREAQALNRWVTAQAAKLAALGEAEDSGPRPPVGLSALEQSLISADLRRSVTGLANRAEAGIDLEFGAVDFSELMNWLSAEDPGWGYDIAAFRIIRGDEPGIVAAEFRLERAGLD